MAASSGATVGRGSTMNKSPISHVGGVWFFLVYARECVCMCVWGRGRIRKKKEWNQFALCHVNSEQFAVLYPPSLFLRVFVCACVRACRLRVFCICVRVCTCAHVSDRQAGRETSTLPLRTVRSPKLSLTPHLATSSASRSVSLHTHALRSRALTFLDLLAFLYIPFH